MKHRVAAKGKNMYVIVGLLALLLGSLAYLATQSGTREGMEDRGDDEEKEEKEEKKEKKLTIEGMKDMDKKMEGMEHKLEGMKKKMEGMKGKK